MKTNTKRKNAEAVRLGEIVSMKKKNRRVYRMSDGTLQAVYRFSAPQDAVDEIDEVPVEEADGKHYRQRRPNFTARFSRDEENDELFSVEKEAYRVTVTAKKKKRQSPHGTLPVCRENTLVFKGIKEGADYEYSVNDTGIKENIVVKKPGTSYAYSFILACEGVRPVLSKEATRVSFVDGNETEIFHIPAPFMTDAAGVRSEALLYALENIAEDSYIFTVTADKDFMNAEERVYPVTIDPQIVITPEEEMLTTYGWQGNGLIEDECSHRLGVFGPNTYNRVYIDMAVLTLPFNPRIKKAELILKGVRHSDYESCPAIGVYRVPALVGESSTIPAHDASPMDYAREPHIESHGYADISYRFDITPLWDSMPPEEWYTSLVVKMLEESGDEQNYVTIFGSQDSENAPEVVITYEASYGVNTSYPSHTHSLGSHAQGLVDLETGNLTFEIEDFVWQGCRMPVTIKHLYNSALAGFIYTDDPDYGLHTADFAKTRVGNGFRLNVMQSMVAWEGQYVQILENGEERYFKAKSEDEGNVEFIPEDGGDALYNATSRTLTEGDTILTYDDGGKLIAQREGENTLWINYTDGRLVSVTDGVGRAFVFAYNNVKANRLISITAPDETAITYTHSSSNLSAITYPDGTSLEIAYNGNYPSSVTLKDENGSICYRVAYTFENYRLARFTDYYGEDLLPGKTTSFTYAKAAKRTVVSVTEIPDTDMQIPVMKTVYTFDNDGNVIGEYTYAEENDGSGIHPVGDTGAVCHTQNYLKEHNFEHVYPWRENANDENFVCNTLRTEADAKFGKYALYMQSTNRNAIGNGITQTVTLPAGEYTFSAYLRVVSPFSDGGGAYLQIVSGSNILGVSERLTTVDSDYTRLILPFTLAQETAVSAYINVDGAGTVLIDGAQLERNPYASAYNMLENGGFEDYTMGWGCAMEASGVDSTSFDMLRSLCIPGDLSSERAAKQEVFVRTAATTRETFTLAGWAKGYGIPCHEREGAPLPVFELRAEICYADGEKESFSAPFSPATEEWQPASVTFAKSACKKVDHVKVYCDYSYNYGYAYFDSIRLVRNSIETELSAEDFVTTSEVEETDDETTQFDTDASDAASDFEEAKDAFGNVLTETTFTDGEFGTIYRAFGYNGDDENMGGYDAGNNLTSEIDARGNTTHYIVNSTTSRNEKVTDRCGNKTAYEYDDSGRTTKVTSKDAEGAEIAHVSYAYDAFGDMTEIVRGDGMKYVLGYDAFHNLASIGIEGKTTPLIKYLYRSTTGRIKRMTYANGHTMKAVYNSIGQMVAEKWFETEAEAADSNATPIAHYKYVYDGDGNIVRSIDICAEKEYTYMYEEGKLLRATEADITLSGEIVASKVIVNTVKYYYDTEGKMTKKVITPASGSAQTIYYETNDDNTVVKFSAGGRTVTSHSGTDSFGRKVFDELQLGTDFVSRQFLYHAGKVTDEHKENEKVKSSATTQLVSQIVLSDGRTLSYGYDNEERITSVTETYTVGEETVTNTTLYTYDALGQLLTETKKVETIDRATEIPTVTRTENVVNTMTYDNYGNILSKNGVAYTYGDSVWKDLLTKVGNDTITYDAQGNPLTYLGHTLTWEKGRQLASFDGNTYTYNANGIRTSKTVNGVKHTYTLDGTKILREVWGDNTLVPLYDNEDSVCGIIYNDTPYYFLKNLQGDVIAIVDENAEVVARYAYDAWGKIKLITDGDGNGVASSASHIANVNPFRYRSYYYDAEIAKYYLQSRYYDSGVGRFINADSPIYVGAERDNICALNLQCYCKNNAINLKDSAGYLAVELIIGAIYGAVMGLLGYFLDIILSNFSKILKKLKDFWGIIKREIVWWKLLAAVVFGAASGALGTTNKKKLLTTIVNLISSLHVAITSGLSILGAIITGIITFIIQELMSTAQSFSKFNFKKVTSSGTKTLKTLRKSELSQFIKTLSNSIIYYIKSNSTLYKRFFAKYAEYTIAQWVVALGIKGGDTLVKIFA